MCQGSRIAEEAGYSEEEKSYVKQGEDALQTAISILSEQDGWTVETVAVSVGVTYIRPKNNEVKIVFMRTLLCLLHHLHYPLYSNHLNICGLVTLATL